MNFPAAILEQGHGKIDRQVEVVGAFHVFTEIELVDHDVVISLQGPILDMISGFDGELTLADGPAHIPAGIGAGRGEVHLLEIESQIGIHLVRQRVDGP